MTFSRAQQLALGLVVSGLVWRALPLFDLQGRLLTQWPTEDGYFMLTMARNIALGRGLSVAGGEMLTNGTQPFTTFVWAGLYSLFGVEWGVLGVQLVSLLVALATCFGIHRLGLRVGGEARRDAAALAAGLWFVSPVITPHTMNCLETGFYGLITVLVALALLEGDGSTRLWSWRRTFGFGALLGVAFWIRNDATFLIATSCAYYLGSAFFSPSGSIESGATRGAVTSSASGATRGELGARLGRVLAFGATSVVVASPWLVYNVLYFGHLMPVSGRAEALTGSFASNLPLVALPLVEYLGLLLPVPHSISDRPAIVLGAWLVLVAVIVAAVRWRAELTRGERGLLAFTGCFALGLAVFYGFFFGAAWFLPRYFFPLGPLLAVLVVGAIERVLRGAPAVARRALPVALGAAVVLATFVSLRQYRRGDEHAHFHVVEWVKRNVEKDTWVGAIQTGTLGYFHERTVNLDGKVNVRAYEALRSQSEGHYVVHETEIEYLVDWIGMRDWLNKPIIAEHFELIEHDEAGNLAVLRRR